MEEALLVVLAIVCALAILVHLARAAFVRARSVERHRQALDTLAGITQPGSLSTSSGPGNPHESQAHVRILVPESGSDMDLPPPRPFAHGSARSSPFRRPARRSRGSIAVATGWPSARGFGGSTMEPDLPPPPAGADRDERATRVLPVVAPPPPPATGVARNGTGRAGGSHGPHVFYFDDLPAATPGTERADEPADPLARGNPATGDAGPTGPPPAGPLRRYAPVQRESHDVRGDEGAGPIGTGPIVTGPGSSDAVEPLPAGPEEPERLVVIEEEPSGPIASDGRTAPPRSKRGLAVAAASAAVLGAGVAGALVLSSGGTPAARTSTPPTTAPVAHNRGHTSTSTKATGTTARPTTSTSTTAPPRPASLVSATAGSAVYQLRSASASIVISASGPCWIEVRAGSSQGQVVYEGILAAGQTSSVTGPAWMRLGDPPNAKVTVDGTQMHVPGADAAVPVNLQFTLG